MINNNISPTKQNNNNNNNVTTTPTSNLMFSKQPIKIRESAESPFKSMLSSSNNSTPTVQTPPITMVEQLTSVSTPSTTTSSSYDSNSNLSDDSSSISDNETTTTTTTASKEIKQQTSTTTEPLQPQDFTPILTSHISECVKISNSIGLSNFTITNLVGKGGFGKVFQVVHNETKKIYALKIIKKNHIIAKKSVVNTIAEKDILKRISHPFIVNLHYAFQNEKKLYLVMDFINGGQLFFHLQKEAIFSEDQVRFYIAELVLALEHLHASNIVHRDLKPENILLDAQGHCILTDFGLAKEEVTDDSSKGSFCGTLEYMAPEVLQSKAYGKTVDWWSIGILMFDMMVGKPPFENKNRAIMQEKIVNEKPKFPKFISSPARSLINGLLHKDPKKRLGAKGALEIKQHPFFKQTQWRKIESKEVPPPFIPKTQGIEDISNFDAALKGEKNQRDSFVSSSPNLSSSQQAYFQGFSFVRSPILKSNLILQQPSTSPLSLPTI